MGSLPSSIQLDDNKIEHYLTQDNTNENGGGKREIYNEALHDLNKSIITSPNDSPKKSEKPP